MTSSEMKKKRYATPSQTLVGQYYMTPDTAFRPPLVVQVDQVKGEFVYVSNIHTITIKTGHAIPGGDYTCSYAIMDKKVKPIESKKKYRLCNLNQLLRGEENYNIISDGWRTWTPCKEDDVFSFMPAGFSPGASTHF
jgi:hypothetical protein